MCFSAGLLAQPPGDTSPTYPQGATYTLSNGSTVTLTDQTFDCSTQYYNAVQVSNGTLYLNNGTINTNGYTLTYTSLSGSGTINTGTGINENVTEAPINDGMIYTIDGRCLGTTLPDDYHGVYIQNGKKLLKTN